MLILSPGMPNGVEGRDAGFLHQMKGQSAAMERVVAWSRRVDSATEAVLAIDEAFAHFAGERPRPVHVEVPLDVLESDRIESPERSAQIRLSRPEAGADSLDSAAEALAAGRSPMLLLGGGAVAASREARALAELLDAVVLTTVNGKGVVPESHPLSIGAALRLRPAREALEESDVVLAVGTEIGQSDLWTRRPLRPRGELVRIDLDPGQLDKNLATGIHLLGDAGATMAALAERLPDRGPGEGAARAAALRAELAPLVERDAGQYALLHRVLRRTLPERAILTGDSSMVTYYGGVHQFPVEAPRRFLYPVGYATLGYALPAAIGAKLACPESEVVAVEGDGAFLFCAAEIATAADLELPLPVIVFDNGGYGEIRAEMLERGIPPIGVDMGRVDFAELGRSLGGAGEWVGYEEGALEEALRAALARSGPSVLAIDARRIP
jgi:acetolactate synthase-1/2/3 large subunit